MHREGHSPPREDTWIEGTWNSCFRKETSFQILETRLPTVVMRTCLMETFRQQTRLLESFKWRPLAAITNPFTERKRSNSKQHVKHFSPTHPPPRNEKCDETRRTEERDVGKYER